LCITATVPCHSAEPSSYLLREDIRVGGLVLTVNRTGRAAFAGGMAQQQRQALFEVNISLVNTGREAIRFETQVCTALEMQKRYSPCERRERDALDPVFTLHPGTQTHGSVWFLVDADEPATPAPTFCFTQGDASVQVLLDEELTKWRSKGVAELERDQAVRIARFFIFGNRPNEARDIIDRQLLRTPHDALFLLLRAQVAQTQGNRAEMGHYLDKIADASTLPPSEIRQLAKLAYDLDQSTLCIKVLECVPAGQLASGDVLLLAKAHYDQRHLDDAERLLIDLENRGERNPEITFTLGNIADKRDDINNAVRWWQKTLEYQPQHGLAQFNIGVILYRQGRSKEARDAWQRVMGMNPDPDVRAATEDALKNVQ